MTGTASKDKDRRLRTRTGPVAHSGQLAPPSVRSLPPRSRRPRSPLSPAPLAPALLPPPAGGGGGVEPTRGVGSRIPLRAAPGRAPPRQRRRGLHGSAGLLSRRPTHHVPSHRARASSSPRLAAGVRDAQLACPRGRGRRGAPLLQAHSENLSTITPKAHTPRRPSHSAPLHPPPARGWISKTAWPTHKQGISRQYKQQALPHTRTPAATRRLARSGAGRAGASQATLRGI